MCEHSITCYRVTSPADDKAHEEDAEEASTEEWAPMAPKSNARQGRLTAKPFLTRRISRKSPRYFSRVDVNKVAEQFARRSRLSLSAAKRMAKGKMAQLAAQYQFQA